MGRTTETPRGERMVKILVHLIRNKGRKFTSAEIKSWLDSYEAVDIRNVQRDLQKLADMESLTCVKRERKGPRLSYFMEADMRNHMTMPIQRNTLLAMFMLKRIQPFFAPKTNTLKEMGEALADLSSQQDFDLFDDLDQKLEDSTHILGEQSVLALDEELLNNLMRALVERRMLKVQYQRNNNQEPVAREICPAKLILFKGELYFLCISRYYGDREYFIKLCRILKADLTDTHFDVEPKRLARIHNRLKKSFGILDDDVPRPEKVVLQFPEYFDLLLKEKTFHNTQKLRRAKTGEMILTMNVPVDYELVKWVLGWEDKAVVIHPRKLRNWMKKIGLRLAVRYK